MSEQLDLETLVLNAERERRAAREERAAHADEERAADRLAGMLNEIHNAMHNLCPECRERVNEHLAGSPK